MAAAYERESPAALTAHSPPAGTPVVKEAGCRGRYTGTVLTWKRVKRKCEFMSLESKKKKEMGIKPSHVSLGILCSEAEIQPAWFTGGHVHTLNLLL